MPSLNELIVMVFGALLIAAVMLFIVLHYYEQKAKRHFSRAEKRIEHAEKLLKDADSTVTKIRAGMKSKASVRQAEEKISAAISDLLGAAEEEKKAVKIRA